MKNIPTNPNQPKFFIIWCLITRCIINRSGIESKALHYKAVSVSVSSIFEYLVPELCTIGTGYQWWYLQLVPTSNLWSDGRISTSKSCKIFGNKNWFILFYFKVKLIPGHEAIRFFSLPVSMLLNWIYWPRDWFAWWWSSFYECYFM